MNITVQNVYDALHEFALFGTEHSWDNCGILAGNAKNMVNSVGVALDITPQTIACAAAAGVDLMVSHHPVMFSGTKNLDSREAPYMLARNGMSAICLHTNLDAAVGGINDRLCEIMGFGQCEGITDISEPDKPPLGRMFVFSKPMELDEIAALAGARFGTRPRMAGQGNVSRLVVCSGGGGEFILSAAAAGADAMLTGEVSHSKALLADSLGLKLILCGHFATEAIIKPVLAKCISDALPALAVTELEESDIFRE